MKEKLLTGLTIVALMIGTAGIASADLYTEVGDAGETLATAQMLPGGIDMIQGNIDGDADLFGFAFAGGFFGVTTDSLITTFDTQLFLFDGTGAGILSNDDDSGLRSRIITSSPLAPGNYFLGISSWNKEPLDASSALIFTDFISGQNGPVPGSGPLASWNGSGSSSIGQYEILFEDTVTADPNPNGGPGPAPVPEPATMLLLGTGLVDLLDQDSRKRRCSYST